MTGVAAAPPRSERKRRKQLTRSDVVNGAISIIDEKGLEALTMRGLAEYLGVYPTTLYWHAGTKAQLLALACEEVLSAPGLPEYDGSSWQEWLVAQGYWLRSVFQAHPTLLTYYTTKLQVGASSLARTERTLLVLSDAGFKGRNLVYAFNNVSGTINGFLAAEFSDDPNGEANGWEEYFKEKLETIDPDGIPTMLANLPELRNRAFSMRWESGQTSPLSDSFAFMLKTLVGGLETQLLALSG